MVNSTQNRRCWCFVDDGWWLLDQAATLQHSRSIIRGVHNSNLGVHTAPLLLQVASYHPGPPPPERGFPVLLTPPPKKKTFFFFSRSRAKNKNKNKNKKHKTTRRRENANFFQTPHVKKILISHSTPSGMKSKQFPLCPPCAPTNGRPGFPFGFLGAGGRLPKARRGRFFNCVILFLLPASYHPRSR